MRLVFVMNWPWICWRCFRVKNLFSRVDVMKVMIGCWGL